MEDRAEPHYMEVWHGKNCPGCRSFFAMLRWKSEDPSLTPEERARALADLRTFQEVQARK